MRGPAILLTEGVQNLRLDGLLTLINFDKTWKLGRIDEFDTLSGADEGEREEI